MAIKYKFLKQVKKDSEAVDVKDRVIAKQGHIVFFTLSQMEDNEKSLEKTREKINLIIEPIKELIDNNPVEYTEEQQNAIMMYREAELRLDADVTRLADDEKVEDETQKLSEKEITQIKSDIEYSKAVMENIKHFHTFILDITGEEADKVSGYRRAYIQYKEAKDKLDEINDILRSSEIEKAEIYKQLNIQ